MNIPRSANRSDIRTCRRELALENSTIVTLRVVIFVSRYRLVVAARHDAAVSDFVGRNLGTWSEQHRRELLVQSFGLWFREFEGLGQRTEQQHRSLRWRL